MDRREERKKRRNGGKKEVCLLNQLHLNFRLFPFLPDSSLLKHICRMEACLPFSKPNPHAVTSGDKKQVSKANRDTCPPLPSTDHSCLFNSHPVLSLIYLILFLYELFFVLALLKTLVLLLATHAWETQCICAVLRRENVSYF